MNPPFTYFGGKTGMADLVVSLMPPHRVYIEPFFGSGAVLFAKPPSVHEIVNDLDHAVVAFFRTLRDRPDELIEACTLTPYARDEFNAAELDSDPIDDLELARRFWVRVNQSFAKTAGRRTGWSVTTARTQSAPGSVRARLGRFTECADRLADVTIECCDAAGLVDRLANTPATVIYVDPPYVRSSRCNPGATAVDYRCDLGEEDDHRRLAEALRATPATVILSGYPSPLYDELYGDWWSMDLSVSAHSSRASKRPKRVERLWSNRELDTGRLFALTSIGGGLREP